jgi:hypothetical protein
VNAPPWTVGQTIGFSGSASDPEDGALPASALSWSLVLQHCPSNCHTHQIQTWDGVASGSFVAPDHDYPSYLELTLTATDSLGKSTSVTRRLDPQTVVLSFATAPSGLTLGVDASTQATPFTRTVIVGSAHSISAAASQSLNGVGYSFGSWSDGGARVHTITAPATATTYTATYVQTTRTVTPLADAETRQNQAAKNFGTALTMQERSGKNAYRSYLLFDVSGLTGAPTNAKLRLWVTDASSASRGLYVLANTTWTETGITWNSAPALPGTAYRTFSAGTAGAWVEIDLGTLVTGNGRYAFAISGGSSDVVAFQTKEGANDPQLVLTLP